MHDHRPVDALDEQKTDFASISMDAYEQMLIKTLETYDKHLKNQKLDKARKEGFSIYRTARLLTKGAR